MRTEEAHHGDEPPCRPFSLRMSFCLHYPLLGLYKKKKVIEMAANSESDDPARNAVPGLSLLQGGLVSPGAVSGKT